MYGCQSFNPHVLFTAAPVWEGPFCEEDVDSCTETNCFEEVECFDVPAPGMGATCGPCPTGLEGDGIRCTGK